MFANSHEAAETASDSLVSSTQKKKLSQFSHKQLNNLLIVYIFLALNRYNVCHVSNTTVQNNCYGKYWVMFAVG